MSFIFVADLILYLILLLPAHLIAWWHRGWSNFLPWYYMIIFCLARVVGGALGVHDSDSLAANIIVSVGISPLILAVDGLLHEARSYRHPSQRKFIGWSFIILTHVLVAAGIALAVTGALDIYEGHPKSDSLTHWKAGVGLMVVAWVLVVLWAGFSLHSSQSEKGAAGYQGGTTLLQGVFITLVFVGIRVIYALIAVCTQRKDLSSTTGTVAVKAVLVFLPEALAALSMIFVGFRTKNLRRNSNKAGGSYVLGTAV
ncbi:integral membrane protein [Aspergillus ellipticus CBS 707.79]|uniref:Integral membrane protein n=1 Tax=Aspergillus ellipticus CBS 707.79 TaxID=1448320 RepID=A0A319DJZ5_9EURO|nr:integral membrane protein [Aspergillus ellipticus CBS 707.79]